MRDLSIASFLRRYHFVIVAVIVGMLLVGETIFLYRYFYQALTESRIVYELKQRAALEELKIDLYLKLTQFYEIKRQERPIDWGALHDPFAIVPSAAPSP